MVHTFNSTSHILLFGGEGWLGFPDLRSGQKPWCNWYLTPVVNLGEVRRAQLAKFTLLYTLVPLGTFKVFSDAKQRVGCGKQRDYLGSWVYSGRPAFGQNCNHGSCVCSERPALGQNTLMTMMLYYTTSHYNMGRRAIGISGSLIW